jgi:hypothetical protein
MVMKKNLLIAAIAITALAGCTSDEYIGDNSPTVVQGTNVAINFSSKAGKMTRATSNTGSVARMLDHQFKVYGVKNVSNTYSNVFVNYLVWDSNTKTTSNPDVVDTGDRNGWEYVGAAGTYGAGSGSDGDNGTGVAISNAQTIKYWDYSAANYHFAAGSPYGNFTFNLTSGDISTATVTGLAGHITANPVSGEGTTLSANPVYIADPVNVTSTDYNKEVVFSFKRQQSFVRVGVYETIPGYKISSISFYEQGESDWNSTAQTGHNIVLASKTANYFSGASNATAKVSYNWETPNYTFSFTSGLTQQKNWYGGKLDLSASNPLATTSTATPITYFYGTDKDMAATGYFTVIPSASALTAQPILIKCDYTLTSTDGSNEEIHVQGATAAIPAAFSKWDPNTSYTYLFKISDNTNGKTDTNQPNEGLYPITFDAVVFAATDNAEGYITTVSTPSITTYQEGSVTDNGIEYKSGTAITATVATPVAIAGEPGYAAGAVLPINTTANSVGCVNVYYLGTTAKTEADMQVTPPTTGGQSITISDNILSFTPATNDIEGTAGTAIGYYAIQYLTATSPAIAYTYKIIAVKKATTE